MHIFLKNSNYFVKEEENTFISPEKKMTFFPGKFRNQIRSVCGSACKNITESGSRSAYR